MRPGDILSGAPFRVAAAACLAFIVIYGLGAWQLSSALLGGLEQEMETQVESEGILLETVYEERGRSGLVETMGDMSRFIEGTDRIAGLFDAEGRNLAGPLPVLPDFTGIEPRRVARAGGTAGYVLRVSRLEKMTLVVGRDRAPLVRARRALVVGLVSFGLILSAVVLTLGAWASRASFLRLRAMERALGRIADGEAGVRLPVRGRADQFDRVSVQMNANLDRLSRLMAAMKSTASAIAHDLKTPLSHAHIAIQDAVTACEAGEDPLPKIEDALAEIDALNALFETMLRISRIQGTTDRKNFEPVDLAELAEKTASFLAPMADELGQSVTLDLAPVPTVEADKSMLQQMAINILRNAVEHAGKGAAITLRTAATPDAAIFEVADTGPGIAPEDRTRVLEAFTRLDSARGSAGSGLGLALVKAVADLHGATLSLDDAGPGLVVRVEFPNLKNS